MSASHQHRHPTRDRAQAAVVMAAAPISAYHGAAYNYGGHQLPQMYVPYAAQPPPALHRHHEIPLEEQPPPGPRIASSSTLEWLKNTPLPTALAQLDGSESSDSDQGKSSRRRSKRPDVILGPGRRSKPVPSAAAAAAAAAAAQEGSVPPPPLPDPRLLLGRSGVVRDSGGLVYDPSNPSRKFGGEDGRAVRRAGAVSAKQLEAMKQIEAEEELKRAQEEQQRQERRRRRRGSDDGDSSETSDSSSSSSNDSELERVVRVQRGATLTLGPGKDSDAESSEVSDTDSDDDDEESIPVAAVAAAPGRRGFAPGRSRNQDAAELLEKVPMYDGSSDDRDTDDAGSDEADGDTIRNAFEGISLYTESPRPSTSMMTITSGPITPRPSTSGLITPRPSTSGPITPRPSMNGPVTPRPSTTVSFAIPSEPETSVASSPTQPPILADNSGDLLHELEMSRLACKDLRKRPVAAIDAANFILDNIHRASKLDGDVRRHMCETAVRTFERTGNLASSVLDPHVAATAQCRAAGLYVGGTVPGFIDTREAEAAQLACEKDHAKAFALYSSAAKKDHADSFYYAGLCHERGLGIFTSHAQAVHNYKKAARRNHPGAQYRLGKAFLNGELSVPKNLREAVKWLKLSATYATRQFPEALYALAKLHEDGDGSADRGRAIVWSDHAYVLQLLERGSELGHAECMFRLGEAYEYGLFGLDVNPEKSIWHYTAACEAGSAEALFELAGWHLTGASNPSTGFVLPQSDLKAKELITRAAVLNLPKAMYAMGYFLEMGFGDPRGARDVESAALWYRRAAADGDVKAKKKVEELGLSYGERQELDLRAAASLIAEEVAGERERLRRSRMRKRAEMAANLVKIKPKRDLDEDLDGGNKCAVM